MGRDWLYKLRLDWPELFRANKHDDPRVSFLQSTSWINEFPDVTKDGLGLLKGIKADVELKPGARAKFCKNRPIPFSLKEQEEKAIQGRHLLINYLNEYHK